MQALTMALAMLAHRSLLHHAVRMGGSLAVLCTLWARGNFASAPLNKKPSSGPGGGGGGGGGDRCQHTLMPLVLQRLSGVAAGSNSTQSWDTSMLQWIKEVRCEVDRTCGSSTSTGSITGELQHSDTQPACMNDYGVVTVWLQYVALIIGPTSANVYRPSLLPSEYCTQTMASDMHTMPRAERPLTAYIIYVSHCPCYMVYQG